VQAGHFYVAHLLGCPVTDFSVGGWVALRQASTLLFVDTLRSSIILFILGLKKAH
jgi:hypothetical protein